MEVPDDPSYPRHWSLDRPDVGSQAAVQLVIVRHSGGARRVASKHVDTSEADAVIRRWEKGMGLSTAPSVDDPLTGLMCRPAIKLIERIENGPLWSAFQKACSPMLRLSGTREVLAWHGTSKEAAWRIAHEGFREGRQGLWAAHCSGTSWDYCIAKTESGFVMPPGRALLEVMAPSSSRHSHDWKGEYVMLLCRVLLVNLPHPNVNWRSISRSALPPWGRGATHMLHSPALAYPEYLVHFSTN